MTYALNHDPASPFPPVEHALDEPNGLLAIGGCLSPERLINAYQSGIFPWYSEGQPILWWSPSPRLVLYPSHIYISKSMAKLIRKHTFEVTVNRNFRAVIEACSEAREHQDGTWILPEMKTAYLHLHEIGVAHCIECYMGTQLVGGLYGIKLGDVFFGESMFSHVSNASKFALIHLCQNQPFGKTKLIDCQVHSNHLVSMGAVEIPREKFIAQLRQYI